jgi:hypothetical protein
MLYQRTLILNNQLNFSMLVIMIVILIFLSIMRSIEGTSPAIGSLRLYLVMFLNIGNLVFAYFKKNQLSKLLFLFFPPIIIFIEPFLFFSRSQYL